MMKHRIPSWRRTAGRAPSGGAGGFTLIEVLIAIGIFGIGLVAVASIFPVAILLQKQTVQEVESTHFGSNAKAIVAAKGFEDSTTNWNAIATAGVVAPMPEDAMDKWSLGDRSYNTLENWNQRRVFWVPLCFDADPGTDKAWQVFIFVVRSERDKTYPGTGNDVANPNDPTYVPRVKRINTTISGLNRFDFGNNPRLIRPGEDIVDEFGISYRVSQADDAGVVVDGAIPRSGTINIWYAAPGTAGQPSTFVKLITLIDSDPGEPDTGDGDIIRTP